MLCRCGNVAAILELDENLNKKFRVFDAAPQVCEQYLGLNLIYIMLDQIVFSKRLVDASRTIMPVDYSGF